MGVPGVYGLLLVGKIMQNGVNGPGLEGKIGMSDIHNPRTWHWAYGMPESLRTSEARMAIKTFNITHNSDGTITVRANNYTESIGVEGKTKEELCEAVRYALICANFDWNDETEEFVHQILMPS